MTILTPRTPVPVARAVLDWLRVIRLTQTKISTFLHLNPRASSGSDLRVSQSRTMQALLLLLTYLAGATREAMTASFDKNRPQGTAL